ncbi:MAG: ATP-binding cassette domain-containing protein [Candidatus Omnitrophota bacterium]
MSLLEIKNLRKYFPYRAGLAKRLVGEVKAVDGVSFSVEEGKTVGLVGESGCGKTTLGKIAIGLLPPTAGEVSFEGENIYHLKREKLRNLRKDFQIVFQDPFNSLNPRMKIGDIVAEPLIVHAMGETKSKTQQMVKGLLTSVELSPDYARRYPHEFSGGQRQRIGIARAIATNPKLIILDEPVSSLDVSVQAQVLNLLMDLQEKFKIAYLFIAHNLRVIEHMSDEIVVMYLGKIVEKSPNRELYKNPQHPYTKALLEASHGDISKVKALKGELPSPISPLPRMLPFGLGMLRGAEALPDKLLHSASGCRFRTRCPFAFKRCEEEEPQLTERGPAHFCACHLV